MSDFLPEDLATEILVRLPMKDLARFRCVCKTWRNLINHHDFAERYNHISPAKFVSFYDKKFYLLDVEDKNPVIRNPQKLDFPLNQSMIDKSACVLCCDGTLCITLKYNTLMVWNPFSKQFKIVPNPGIYRDSNILGFGYDPVLDDYKVVTFIDRLDSSTAHVYEFKTDSWTEGVRIPNPDWHYRERKGTLLDQHLYWIAYRSSEDRFILCFNISTHEYRKFPLSAYKQGVMWSSLSVTSQKLCITEYEPDEKEIQVSVMEKTGSWSRIICLSMSNLICVRDWIRDYQVEFVSFTKKNDLVITFTGYFDNLEPNSEEREKKKVFLYKSGEDTLVQVRLCNSLAGFRFLGECVETLVVISRIFV